VKSYCLKHGARKCSSVFLIRKTHARKRAEIRPDFFGLECDDSFVYGVGMDLNGHFRNLSAIYALPEKVV
jgi:hypoxanthine phosphoribosyltransferase